MTAGQLMAHAGFAMRGDSRESMMILGELLGCPPLELALRRDMELSSALEEKFWQMRGRLGKGEPPQYILGKACFFGHEFEVSPAVLIPRPETEGLVELALRFLAPGKRILDIGTGSGAIAISLQKAVPGLAVHATDIQPAALETAKRNAKSLGADITFWLADLFPAERGFDLIISNPPYISSAEYAALEPRVRDHEPQSALLADEDGMIAYRRILSGAGDFLNPGGILLFEHGDTQRGKLRALGTGLGWTCFLEQGDLAGRDRYIGFTHAKER